MKHGPVRMRDLKEEQERNRRISEFLAKLYGKPVTPPASQKPVR